MPSSGAGDERGAVAADRKIRIRALIQKKRQRRGMSPACRADQRAAVAWNRRVRIRAGLRAAQSCRRCPRCVQPRTAPDRARARVAPGPPASRALFASGAALPVGCGDISTARSGARHSVATRAAVAVVITGSIPTGPLFCAPSRMADTRVDRSLRLAMVKVATVETLDMRRASCTS